MDEEHLSNATFAFIIATGLFVLIDDAFALIQSSNIFKGLKIAAACGSLLFGFLRWKNSAPFVFEFDENSWVEVKVNERETNFVIELPRNRHKKGKHAKIEVLVAEGDEFHPIIIDSSLNKNGDIQICGLSRFTGKAVVTR